MYLAYKAHQQAIQIDLSGLRVGDSKSKLTSAMSNEASISSSNNVNEMANSNNNYIYAQQNIFMTSPSDVNQPQPAPKKRRNLPGNPDPEAEVVALSPRSLMATNRFVCEICNKGFQRDQNLQLHRRGHNLPWKLKQRNKQEVIKKKVYVCPEPGCVHHDPFRALGDLTGIKKHFSRKHGEKKWKCEKCSKRYAVQSDWKAHSKICGTREYRCDCGTLFSRRDSFITHRAFCDALAQENSRSMTQQNPFFISSQTTPNANQSLSQQIHTNLHNNFHHHPLIIPHLKQENSNIPNNHPPWLSHDHQPGAGTPFDPLSRAQPSFHQEPNPSINNTTFSSSSSSSPNTCLMSATALLQKAAQMGVTMSGNYRSQPSDQNHHAAGGILPPREGNKFVSSFSNAGDNADVSAGDCMQLHDMNDMVSSSLPSSSTRGGAFDHGSFSFEESFNEILNPSKRGFGGFQESAHLMMGWRKEGGGRGGDGGGGGGGDGLTRDFLGLRAFPDHRDFMNMAGLDQMGSTPYDNQQVENQGPWQS